jgi:hypothetical protein
VVEALDLVVVVVVRIKAVLGEMLKLGDFPVWRG